MRFLFSSTEPVHVFGRAAVWLWEQECALPAGRITFPLIALNERAQIPDPLTACPSSKHQPHPTGGWDELHQDSPAVGNKGQLYLKREKDPHVASN